VSLTSYEWGQHAIIGERAGLTRDEINRIKEGPGAPGWNEFDATLLDLIFTVGQYNLVSMALNTLGVQLDEGIAGFEQ
jgi:hypothetical protein